MRTLAAVWYVVIAQPHLAAGMIVFLLPPEPDFILDVKETTPQDLRLVLVNQLHESVLSHDEVP
jgi:hypothetical protein